MAWFRRDTRRRREQERDEEMRAHLEMYAEQLAAQGRPVEDARREARLRFGNPRVKLEEVSALTRIPVVDTVLHDLRMAVRSLRAAPGFTATVLVVLALAMGATTAIYSVADATVLRPLPFVDGDRVVTIDHTWQGRVVVGPFSAPEYLAFLAHPDLFNGLAAVTDGTLVLRRDSRNVPELLRGQRVTAAFFSVLQVTPLLGRAFTGDNEVAGHDSVALISYGLWQRRFGQAADVIGQRLPTARGDIDVIGVLPQGFAYPVGAVEATDVWTPYVIPEKERNAKFSSYLRLIGRLKDGTSLAAAQARLDQTVVEEPMLRPRPGTDEHLVLRTLRESLVANARSWMWLVLAGAGAVLIIACINVSNLLLVRSTTRAREFSVRSALGATPWDLVRLLVTESVLLSILGAFAGLLVAAWGVAILKPILPPLLPRVGNVAVNLRVLMAVSAGALLAGLTMGLVPAVRRRRELADALRQNGRSETASSRQQRVRSVLLIAEAALAAALLVGGALFLVSFTRVMRVDMGLDYRDVFTLDVRPSVSAVRGAADNDARLSDLLVDIQRLPGVGAAAIATANVPFSLSMTSTSVRLPGRDLPPQLRGISDTQVSPDYFSTLGIVVRRGRSFTVEDIVGAEPVALLNEAAARTYFANDDPIGRTIEIDRTRTIVGVVADVRGFGPEAGTRPEVFTPIAQRETRGGTLIIRTTTSAAVVVPAVKAAIWTLFPEMAIPSPVRSTSASRLSSQRGGRVCCYSICSVCSDS